MRMSFNRLIGVFVLLFALSASLSASEANKFYSPQVKGAAGQEIVLPFYMSNTSEITAIQFSIEVPDGFYINTSEAALTSERKSDHVIAANSGSSNSYIVMAYSPTNQPFLGQSGKILTLGITVPYTAVEGNAYNVVLDNVVLCMNDGSNVVTGFETGSIVIAKNPDLTVSNTTADLASYLPGDKLSAAWTVANIGDLATESGWKEQIYISSGSTDKLIATTYYDATLAAGASVSRAADVVLPEIMNIEGDANLKVKVVPNANAGEGPEAQDNNTGLSAVLNIGKKLYLAVPSAVVDENAGTPIRCSLTRSGSIAADEVFAITAGDAARLSVPETVTIPAGQSGAVFYANITDNEVLDAVGSVSISAAGNGYDAVDSYVNIEDNELAALDVSITPEAIVEGGQLKLTVTTNRVDNQAVEVLLSTDNTKHFQLPSSVVIPAGESSVTVDIVSNDDDVPYLTAEVEISASAAKHEPGYGYVTITDNDIPNIELSLTPAQISEADGVNAVMATLRRTVVTDNKITVKLTDNSGGGLYYSTSTIVLEKGVTEAKFSLGAIDNAVVDGEREITITAAVYLSSCNCSTAGTTAGEVAKTITVLDNDGPSLSVVSSKSTAKEGDEITLKITRNTATDQALTVSLASDCDDAFVYDKEVTIPAGATSADVKVTVNANDLSGDSKVAVFTVAVDGYSSGTCWVMLSDQTLPDVAISQFSIDKTEGEVGSAAKLSVTLANTGAASLPDASPVAVFLNGSSTPMVTLYTPEYLAAGQTVELSKEITLPATVGAHTLKAEANYGQKTAELIYTNNQSLLTFKTVPSFTAVATVDKTVYSQGESVLISGVASGSAAANASVEVYVINGGVRQTLNATADASGKFSVTFTPYELQMGHFTVGACFPGEGLKAEQAAFDVYGIKRASTGFIKCETLVGEPYSGEITVVNPGQLDINGVNIEAVSVPENFGIEFTPVTEIKGGESVAFKYVLTGTAASTGDDWQQIPVKITAAQGVELDVTLYCYCRVATGQLKADVSSIKTTMTKGATREYPITVTNTGKGETGKITVALPDVAWMKSATPIEMASLAYGESATIVLSLTPTDDMPLNVPLKGQIGINCENGNGIAVSYNIEPVSESTGTLVVDVCDEYTYYTTEAPHVAGATVTVQHPTTKAVIEKGTTGEDGLCSFTLPEGYYYITVTEPNHDSYANNIIIDPGKETYKTVNLGINGISIDMRYESTEIEDEYSIVTTVKYETNVPIPVVETIIPSRIAADELAEGESLLFNAVLTNKGLITAVNTQLILPESDDKYEITSLGVESIDLAPQQSVVIPVKVTRKPSGITTYATQRSTTRRCYDETLTYYESYCGEDQKIHYIKHTIQFEVCVSTTDNPISSGTPVSVSVPNISTPSINLPSSKPNTTVGTIVSSKFEGGVIADKFEAFVCDTCVNKKMRKLAECYGIDPDHPFKTIFKEVTGDAGNCLVSLSDCSENGWRGYDDCYSGLIDCLSKLCQQLGGALVAVGGVSTATGAGAGVGAAMVATGGSMKGICKIIEKGNEGFSNAKCWVEFTLPCGNKPSTLSTKGVERTSNPLPSYMTQFQEKMAIYYEGLDAAVYTIQEILGSDAMCAADMEELASLMREIEDTPEGELLDVGDLEEFRPQNVTKEEFSAFVQRLNNTTLYEQGLEYDGDRIDYDLLDEYRNTIDACVDAVEQLGYEDVKTMVIDAMTQLEEGLSGQRNSICASITLSLSQTVTMTRQAIRGTLTVYNGHETAAMTDVKLNLEVRDSEGALATAHEFQINAESLNGFAGELALDAGWSLDADKEGVATVLFIPTKYAAPTQSQLYTFAGTISYVDPFTGLAVTRDLAPVTLTVNPSPNLDFTYFMQRDILGDDALTADVVEPSVPAEFSLLINNLGYGDATNVKMTTKQPEIVENEKGLAIDFKLLSSQLNGGDKTLALGGDVVTDFGTIPAQSTAYAQWWLESSLLGHFVDYDVEATHVTSYDNPDLSLLNEVTIHELIRSIEAENSADATKLAGFMVNDIADAEDLPDMLYLSDGTIESVAISDGAEISKVNDNEYVLTVTSSTAGWNYGSVIDPTRGSQELVSVKRASDGKEMSLRNFWQTDRTLRDGREPLYENRLHFADKFTAATESYTLTFTDKAMIALEVESFAGVPESGTAAVVPVEEITVTFNKPVDASTFTTDDIVLNIQGETMESTGILITTEDNKTFTLNLSAVTQANGFYVLTVNTVNIADADGFAGKNGKNTSWVQYVGNKVAIVVDAVPENGGAITPASGAYDYNSTINFAAVAAEGYNFVNWRQGDEVLSSAPEFDYLVTGDATLTAEFELKRFHVIVNSDAECGTVEGVVSAIYDYGTSLNIKAVPANGYLFAGWDIDGEISTDESLVIEVKSDMVINVLFAKIETTKAAYNLGNGWNWVSMNVVCDAQSDVPELMSSLGDAVVSIEDNAASLTYNGEWTGDLTEVGTLSMYRLATSKSATWTVEGKPVDPQSATITLNDGWNMISYLPMEELSVAEALQSLAVSENDIIKSQTEFAIYDGSAWVGTLSMLKPGAGYQYYSQGVKSFNYPSVSNTVYEEVTFDLTCQPVASVAAWTCDPHAYPANMAVIASLSGNVEGRYLIGAFVNDECRGISTEIDGLHFITIYGDAQDSNISFKVWDLTESRAIKVVEPVVYNGGNLGTIQSPVLFAIDETDAITTIGAENVLVYPNPASETLYIKGVNLPIDKVTITSSDGKKCMEFDNVDASTGINVSTLPAGVYFIEIECAGSSIQKQFVKTPNK